MESVCVFCGGSPGRDPAYLASARAFGCCAARAKLRVVFGGGSVGMMGELADGALEEGGEVVGVIPKRLVDRELAHPGVTEMHVVDGMLERKTLMADLSDAFVSLPGGIGTLDELFEMLTWCQLDFHNKPSGLLNVKGYYRGLLDYLDFQVAEGFLRVHHRELLCVSAQPATLIELLRARCTH